MAPRASTGNFSVLKGNAVVVYLYLLHFPDYGYNIAKTFEGMLPKDIQQKRRQKPRVKEKINKNEAGMPLSITQQSHVSTILGSLKSAGLLKFEEIEGTPKRIFYSVILERIGLIPNNQTFTPSFFINLYNATAPKETHINTILSYKNNDYLTVLLHLQAIFVHLLALLLYIYIELTGGLGKLHEVLFKDSGKIKMGLFTIDEAIEKKSNMNIKEFEKLTKSLKKALIKSIERENGEKLSEVPSDLIWLLYHRVLQYQQLLDYLCVSESRNERGISL